ncbi:hypothetical protein [Acinetobacter stercoris]|uniref:Uncharacterized protein n=1 Tax=Acinetobacter stercoris TaxID=2126983 RepID=A0A2U3MV67_9GAMM|nr:hypothetical protein [Acinetobacter stercoris]SPL69321.1 hypothetical protein KPC_0499 [Acinetobacter stercoris]
MKTYIWSYEAKTCHGVGLIKGRIEAVNGLAAKEAVRASNLMIESVQVKLLQNQDKARRERFQPMTEFAA